MKKIRSQRKVVEVLRGIIGSGFSGTQEELSEVLQSKGFSVNQSTISRTLKKIGAVKLSTVDGTKYQLQSVDLKPKFARSISGLVVSVSSNESLIVIKTPPGSAMFVAGFIDHYFDDQILGTVAGDDTIFVCPRKMSLMKQIKSNLQAFLESH